MQGIPDNYTREQNILTVNFNKQLVGWHYGWKGSKHTCNTKHVFSIFAFRKYAAQGNMVLCKVFNSVPFTVYSRRKAKCRVDRFQPHIKLPISTQLTPLSKLEALTVALNQVPEAVFEKCQREFLILYRFLTFFLHKIKDMSSTTPLIENNFSGQTEGIMDGLGNDTFLDILSCLLPVQQSDMQNATSSLASFAQSLSPELRSGYNTLESLAGGSIRFILNAGFTDDFSKVVETLKSVNVLKNMQEVIEKQKLLMFHHIDTDLFIAKYIATDTDRPDLTHVSNDFFQEFSPGLTDCAPFALKYLKQYIVENGVSIDSLADILEETAKAQFIALDLDFPPTVSTAMLVHFQVFNNIDNFSSNLIAAGKKKFENVFQRNYWNRLLYVFFTIVLGRILTLHASQELILQSQRHYENSEEIGNLIKMEGKWQRCHALSGESQKDGIKTFSDLMNLVDTLFGTNITSLLQSLYKQVFKAFKISFIGNKFYFEGEKMLFLQLKGYIQLDKIIHENQSSLGLFNPMFINRRYVGWVDASDAQQLRIKFVICCELPAMASYKNIVYGRYSRWFLNVHVEDDNEFLILSTQAFFFKSEAETTISQAQLEEQIKSNDRDLEAPVLSPTSSLEVYFDNMIKLETRREHFFASRDKFRRQT